MQNSVNRAIPASPTVLRGVGGTTGVQVGRTRVARGEWSCDGPGAEDILVVRVFRPGHAPLLARIAAVVVESGRLPASVVTLSRELGVPCVVGAEGATSRIPDSTRVRVDAHRRSIEIFGP